VLVPRQHDQLLLLLGAPEGRGGVICCASQLLAALEAEVAAAAASPAVGERPAAQAEQLPADPEASMPACHHAGS
jgi:hypothetical protein